MNINVFPFPAYLFVRCLSHMYDWGGGPSPMCLRCYQILRLAWGTTSRDLKVLPNFATGRGRRRRRRRRRWKNFPRSSKPPPRFLRSWQIKHCLMRIKTSLNEKTPCQQQVHFVQCAYVSPLTCTFQAQHFN